MATRSAVQEVIEALEVARRELGQTRRHWTPADRDAHRAVKDALIALYQADEAYDRELSERTFGL